MKTRHAIVGATIFALAMVEFAVLRTVDIRGEVPARIEEVATRVSATPGASSAAYDVSALRMPKRDYLGLVLADGISTDLASYHELAAKIGTKPNLITLYESFADGFAAAQVRTAYRAGVMTVVRWEPFDIPLKDIAAGKHDQYVSTFAGAVRRLNLPIVLTFAHEMNGDWYSWGPHKTDPADYVAAWRRVHDLFQQQDARNVIWTWTANVINPVPRVPLQPVYPGDSYVDWIGAPVLRS